jgi:hypothetical protein
MSESIGADKLVQIRGHYGVITSSTISNYMGIGSDWDWSAGTDTPAANDDNEIEVLGETGNYYFYIQSWDSDEDRIEAEIHNKITLPDEDNVTGKDGSRAGSAPDYTGISTWETYVTDGSDYDTTNACDIRSVAVGTSLSDGYVYVRVEFDANPDLSLYSYWIWTTFDGDTTADYIFGTYQGEGETIEGARYDWDESGLSNSWSAEAGYTYAEDTSGEKHATIEDGAYLYFAVELSAISQESLDLDNFGVGAGASDDSKSENKHGDTDRTPAVPPQEDVTTLSIPEFSTILMPIASVILIVGYNHRLKRKYSNQH